MNQHNTLIIIDWDDTLFPTSFLNKLNIKINNIPNEYKKYLHQLDSSIYSFLNKIKKYGKIVIVSNASIKWLKSSIELYPQTKKLSEHIKFYSARDKHYNSNIYSWKKQSFIQLINTELFNHNNMNIISIGDAEYEYIALINLYKIHPHKFKYLKSVRLLKKPDPIKLIDQINVLSNSIVPIIYQKKNVDMAFMQII